MKIICVYNIFEAVCEGQYRDRGGKWREHRILKDQCFLFVDFVLC